MLVAVLLLINSDVSTAGVFVQAALHTYGKDVELLVFLAKINVNLMKTFLIHIFVIIPNVVICFANFVLNYCNFNKCGVRLPSAVFVWAR